MPERRSSGQGDFDLCFAILPSIKYSNLVSFLVPDIFVPEDKMAEECIGEDDEDGQGDNQGCSVWGQAFSRIS